MHADLLPCLNFDNILCEFIGQLLCANYRISFPFSATYLKHILSYRLQKSETYKIDLQIDWM